MKKRLFENLYLHVPFCNGKCDYCAFYSLPSLQHEEEWLKKILQDADSFLPQCGTIRTLYLGGGTPTLLSLPVMEKLFEGLEQRFSFAPDAEKSMECNPESLTEEKAQFLAEHVNRVSMGVQSFDPQMRRNIGRRGNAEAIPGAVGMLKKHHLKNIGMDLMYALPGQSFNGFQKDVHQALSFGITHLSAYSLTMEEGTSLARRCGMELSEELSADIWERLPEMVQPMHRYEISNYALEGFECRHNQAVWHGETYLGLGPSACSFDGEDRFTQVADLERYLSGEPAEIDRVPEKTRLAEMLIMGLRTVRGWREGELESVSACSLPSEWNGIFEELKQTGFMQRKGFVLTEKGHAFWNDVAEAFL